MMLETMFRKFCCKGLNISTSFDSLLTQIELLGDGTNRIYIYPNQTNQVFVKNKAQENVSTRYRYKTTKIDPIN